MPAASSTPGIRTELETLPKLSKKEAQFEELFNSSLVQSVQLAAATAFQYSALFWQLPLHPCLSSLSGNVESGDQQPQVSGQYCRARMPLRLSALQCSAT